MDGLDVQRLLCFLFSGFDICIYIRVVSLVSSVESQNIMRLCAVAQRVLVFVVVLIANVSGIGVPGQTCAATTDDCMCTTEQGVKLEGWRNTTCNQCVLPAQDSGGCEIEHWDYETFQFGFMFDIQNWRNSHNQDPGMVIDAQTIAVIKIKNSSSVNYPHLTIRGFNTPTCEGCDTGADVPSWAWSAAGEDAAVCANCNIDKIWFFNMHVWASIGKVQTQDTILNFEFYMHDNVYVSRHSEHLVEGMEGLSGNKFMSRGCYQIHEYQMYPLKMSLDRKHFEVDCGVDSNTKKSPYEGEAPGTLMMSESRGQALCTIKAVVGHNLAVQVPSACENTIEASPGVHFDNWLGGVYQYELTHDNHALLVHLPTTSGDDSCSDLMHIVIQNSSNPNHTEHFRVLIPAGTSKQAAAVALALIYDTTSDYVSIVDDSGGGAAAARTVVASVTITLSKYSDTRLPLVADIDSLLVSALDTGLDEENTSRQQITLYTGSNIFSLYVFAEDINILQVLNSDTDYNWVEGITCNVITDGVDSTIVAMSLTTKTGSTPRQWRSDQKITYRVGNVHTLNMRIADGVRSPVLTYSAPHITSAYSVQLNKASCLYQYYSSLMPTQNQAISCRSSLVVLVAQDWCTFKVTDSHVSKD